MRRSWGRPAIGRACRNLPARLLAWGANGGVRLGQGVDALEVGPVALEIDAVAPGEPHDAPAPNTRTCSILLALGAESDGPLAGRAFAGGEVFAPEG